MVLTESIRTWLDQGGRKAARSSPRRISVDGVSDLPDAVWQIGCCGDYDNSADSVWSKLSVLFGEPARSQAHTAGPESWRNPSDRPVSPGPHSASPISGAPADSSEPPRRTCPRSAIRSESRPLDSPATHVQRHVIDALSMTWKPRQAHKLPPWGSPASQRAAPCKCPMRGSAEHPLIGAHRRNVKLCQECSAKFFWYLRLGVLSHRVHGGSPAAEP